VRGICRVCMDVCARAGQSLSYGFVKYDNPDSAQKAIRAVNGLQIENKRIKVAVSKPPREEHKRNLYVSGTVRRPAPLHLHRSSTIDH
jgi:RNA recognition motif-containing protein